MTERDPLLTAAWTELEKSVVLYRGEPVGTVAARDFTVSALAFLMRGQTDIVRNFLSTLVELQSSEKHFDCFRPGQGLMPASFAVQKQGSKGAIKAGRPELANRALDIAASRIAEQRWPEYYDGRDGRFIGKEARSFQTWSIAGFIAAHELLAQPRHVELVGYEENPAVMACSERVADEMAQARS